MTKQFAKNMPQIRPSPEASSEGIEPVHRQHDVPIRNTANGHIILEYKT